MRLPTTNAKQAQLEDARLFHEDLWRAYEHPEQGRVWLEASGKGAVADMVKLSGNLHRFWNTRGFRLRCQVDDGKHGFYLWLEARVVAQDAAA